MPETKIHHTPPTIERLRAPASPLEKAHEVFRAISHETFRNHPDVPKRRLWLEVAARGNLVAQKHYSTADKLQVGAAIELATAVPSFFISQLDLKKHDSKRAPRMPAKMLANTVRYLGSFNSLLRNYALENFSTTADELTDFMVKIGTDSRFAHPDELEAFASGVMSGAQHETADGPILHLATQLEGSPFDRVRDSTDEEDYLGIDYVLEFANSNVGVGVNIKSSLTGVAKHGGKYGDKSSVHNGRIILYSHLTDQELNGRFVVDDDIVAEKAPLLLSELRKQLRNPNLQLLDYESGKPLQTPHRRVSNARALARAGARAS
jgi:hypothetical protein